jgi:hypothetical protein
VLSRRLFSGDREKKNGFHPDAGSKAEMRPLSDAYRSPPSNGFCSNARKSARGGSTSEDEIHAWISAAVSQADALRSINSRS